MLSVNSLTRGYKLSGRSFMYIRKSSGPKIEQCGTPVSTDDQLGHWPLGAIRFNLMIKNFLSRLRRFTDIPIRPSLNSNPSCHTLPRTFKISKKLAPRQELNDDEN